MTGAGQRDRAENGVHPNDASVFSRAGQEFVLQKGKKP
jgi:hypothetical protein